MAHDQTTHDAAQTTHDDAAIVVFVAYAHPIGEDADSCWIATARTHDAARAKIEAQIAESWGDEDGPTDLDDGSWVFWIAEDTI